MNLNHVPLLENDPTEEAILTPQKYLEKWSEFTGKQIPKAPQYGIFTFQYMGLLDYLKEKFEVQLLDESFPYPVFTYKELEIIFVHVPVGGAAAVMTIEELLAIGVKYVLLYGRAGVLDNRISRKSFIIPQKALREEGVSYHYLRPSRYVSASKIMVEAIKGALKKEKVEFFEGATWTTDAPYRETFNKIKKYREEGIITVEMEAASVFALSQYRKAHSGAILLGGDSVAGDEWNNRRKKGDKEEQQFYNQLGLELAVKSLYRLFKEKNT